jgi:hypothetical protein
MFGSDWNRRQLLQVVPALALAGLPGMASAALEKPDDPIQQTLARFWPTRKPLPQLRAPGQGSGATPVIAYMFTNTSCVICQAVHRQFPKGFRDLEMRYVIYPWEGEDLHLLNYMYRPETTVAEYDAYMNRRLAARSQSDAIAQAAQVVRFAQGMAKELIEGDAFGTPFFLTASPGKTPGTVRFGAGDISTIGPLLDAHAA